MVRKVMFICAHNQTRSVAGEGLLKGEEGIEVRSRAAWRGCPRKVRKSDCDWADEVFVMMPGMSVPVIEAGCPKEKIKALWIPDDFGTCERELLWALKQQLVPFGIRVKKSMEQAQKDCWEVTERKMGWGRGTREFFWGWEPPSEEAMVEGKRMGELDEAELEQYGGTPEWHMEEGERRMREAEEGLTMSERERERFRREEAEEKSMEQKLAEFEVAEEYVKRKQKERERMKRKEEEERQLVWERPIPREWEKTWDERAMKRQTEVMSELEKYTNRIKNLFKH